MKIIGSGIYSKCTSISNRVFPPPGVLAQKIIVAIVQRIRAVDLLHKIIGGRYM